jgi:hypothetical protein
MIYQISGYWRLPAGDPSGRSAVLRTKPKKTVLALRAAPANPVIQKFSFLVQRKKNHIDMKET